MRKNVFSIFLIVVCSAIMLFSCQNDEVEMSSLSKIELLKAKSKEFAKKYGVDVTLNEDSLAKYAETMTVEDMEADYKSFAELKESVQVVSVPQASPKLKSLSKKSFIRRRKAETETAPSPLKDKGGDFYYEGKSKTKCKRYACENDYIRINGHIVWSYSAQSKSISCIAYLTPSCDGMRCMTMGCSGCNTSLSERVPLTTAGYNLDGKVSFTATGTATLNICTYNVNIGIRVYVDETSSTNSVSYI